MALFVLAVDWARANDTSPKTILKDIREKKKKTKQEMKKKIERK